jgi:hypothetical protein
MTIMFFMNPLTAVPIRKNLEYMMNKTNLLVDFGILIALLAVTQPGLTSLPLHEWLGVGFLGAIVAHLLLHWSWITSVALRFARKLFHSSRLQFVLDAALFIVFMAALTSGLMISRSVLPFFGLSAVRNPLWTGLHRFSADATLLLAGLHFATHWDWVAGMTKRYLLAPLASLGRFHRSPAPDAMRIVKE